MKRVEAAPELAVTKAAHSGVSSIKSKTSEVSTATFWLEKPEFAAWMPAWAG